MSKTLADSCCFSCVAPGRWRWGRHAQAIQRNAQTFPRCQAGHGQQVIQTLRQTDRQREKERETETASSFHNLDVFINFETFVQLDRIIYFCKEYASFSHCLEPFFSNCTTIWNDAAHWSFIKLFFCFIKACWPSHGRRWRPPSERDECGSSRSAGRSSGSGLSLVGCLWFLIGRLS